MEFNPDAYLAGSTGDGGFDPDAYLGITKKNKTLGETTMDAAKNSLAPLAALANKLQPKNVTGVLPIGGAAVGSALLPGAGTAIGAGVGSIAKRMADIGLGNAHPAVQPGPFIGMNNMFSPKEAINPMVDTAMAGAPETTGGKQVIGAVSDKIEQLKPGFKKALKAVGQMTTGKSKVKVGRIIEDPTAILPESLGGAKSVEDASAAYGRALADDQTLIAHPDGSFTKGLQKTDFGPFKKGHQQAEEVAQTIWDKWKAGEPVSAQEAYDAKRATDKLWPSVVKDRNAEDIRLMSEFKSAMDDVLSSQSGKFAQASKDYARATLKNDFTQILPRTKTGDISSVKSLILPLIEPRKIPFLMATSPMATGVGNLAAQTAMKGLNVVGSNPEARVALAEILQRIMNGRKDRAQQ